LTTVGSATTLDPLDAVLATINCFLKHKSAGAWFTKRCVTVTALLKS
jgi:hypothetical protein